MTNGIIKETFDVLEQELIARGLNPDGNTYDRMIFNMIEITKQEILSKIRRLNKHQTRHNNQNYTAISLRALIGDNQE